MGIIWHGLTKATRQLPKNCQLKVGLEIEIGKNAVEEGFGALGLF
tara:strand:+ start:928 stop:1062 length:135 start_codon:yes stop_codon:yes gene_type:complete